MDATRFSKVLTAAATSAALLVGAATTASAAILTGTFTVDFQNFDASGSSSNASASLATYNDNIVEDTFIYTGPLDFSSTVGAPTVAEFFASAGGSLSNVDVDLSNYTLSTGAGSPGSGTFGTTTLLRFMKTFSPSASFYGTISHDDGITLFADGSPVATSAAPTPLETTNYSFNGSDFDLIYVAANGDPSILQVSAVPVPAAGLLLLTALAGGAAVAHRRRKAS